MPQGVIGDIDSINWLLLDGLKKAGVWWQNASELLTPGRSTYQRWLFNGISKIADYFTQLNFASLFLIFLDGSELENHYWHWLCWLVTSARITAEVSNDVLCLDLDQRKIPICSGPAGFDHWAGLEDMVKPQPLRRLPGAWSTCHRCGNRRWRMAAVRTHRGGTGRRMRMARPI